MRKYFTIYNSHDEIIAAGTAEQCIDKLKMTKGSFYSMVSNIKSGNHRYKNWGIVIEDYDDIKDDDIEFKGDL